MAPFSASPIEGLADRLEDHVGLEREGLAGADEPAVFLARVFELDAGDAAAQLGERRSAARCNGW